MRKLVKGLAAMVRRSVWFLSSIGGSVFSVYSDRLSVNPDVQ